MISLYPFIVTAGIITFVAFSIILVVNIVIMIELIKARKAKRAFRKGSCKNVLIVSLCVFVISFLATVILSCISWGYTVAETAKQTAFLSAAILLVPGTNTFLLLSFYSLHRIKDYKKAMANRAANQKEGMHEGIS